MSGPAVVLDSEWGFKDRRRGLESSWEPVVLCASVEGKAFSFWGRDDRLAQFVAEHHDDLWVAHSAVAEMKYLLRFGIELPPKWFCTLTAFRAVRNKPGFISASLVTALHATGLGHLAPPDKEETREKIVSLDFTEADTSEIASYCLADVTATAALYAKLADAVDPIAMNFWAWFLAAVARMELRGVPLDVATLKLILQNRDHLRDEHKKEANKTAPVYRPNGSFSRKAFFRWIRDNSIRWPQRVNERGRHCASLADDVMKVVEKQHPFIEEVRKTRKTLRLLDKFTMFVDGRSRRHYFSAMPFRSVTGRNQPSRFLFSAPKWMRHLIVPPSADNVLAYCDFSAQEIGVAAALSRDPAMQAMYAAADPHLEFAVMAGAAPAGATRDTHDAVRDVYKTVNLAVLYGQTAVGVAERLGIEVGVARALLDQHRSIFARYHAWSGRIVSAAYERGYAITPCGWRALVPPESKWRTWSNFPIQGAGADLMRVMTIALDQQRVEILAIIHDAWLLSCRREQLPQLHEAVEHARKAACAAVLNGFHLKIDTKIFPDRFEDKPGAKASWEFILSKLPKEKLHVPSE